MSQQPTPPQYPSGSGQPGTPPYQPSYAPLPPQGAYQGPWPSQMPSGTFPGMPTVGLPRPLTLTLAFWLLLAASVLPLATIPAVLDWMHVYLREALIASTARAGRSGNAGAFAQQFSAITAPIVWVSAIAGSALSALMAFGVRAGMNWVRILTTVSAGFTLVGFLGNIAVAALAAPLATVTRFPMPLMVYVISFTAGAIFIAGTILAWLPPSSQYIAARRAAKLGGGYLR
ncbi:hypothetical protein SCMU_32510 [Sinomonas cyclohexanicum]|uniref:Uncharacterized protein n=1 Tax=Sinomonas cyclohexanicum TaxID=322009 RepID=A0ABM7PYN7_SINCY|nr:hypothetical protein [Corynebacterium cyclohexanicum]BCT77409.1 hypothetical protein SCMU_32510 [Corynebacterium cyclohexanicum]